MKTPMQSQMSKLNTTAYGGGGTGEVAYRSDGSIPSIKAILQDLMNRLAAIESRPMMPSSGSGDQGDVCTLDGSSAKWEKADGLPSLLGAAAEDVLTIQMSEGVKTAEWKAPASGLPSTDGKLQRMGLYLDEDENPGWDWLRLSGAEE